MIASSLLAFGPPKGLCTNALAQSLLVKIISDGNFLHSCLDYGGTLQLTRDIAVENGLSVKLICKTYLNYPVKSSPRRLSLCAQISKVKKLFAGVNVEIVPQISSIYTIPRVGYAAFMKKIYYEYQINQLLIEIFPETELRCLAFLGKLQDATLDLGLEDEISIGLTSYDNPAMQGFTSTTLVKAQEMNLQLAPMRILGNPSSDKDVATAIKRLRDFHVANRLFRGITRVSTFNHYQGLVSIIEKEFKDPVHCDPLDVECVKFSGNNRSLAVNPYGLALENNLTRLQFIKDALVAISRCFRQRSLSAIRKLYPVNLI